MLLCNDNQRLNQLSYQFTHDSHDWNQSRQGQWREQVRSGRTDVGSRINPRPPPRPPLPRFAIPIHEYECKREGRREKEGKLGKEIKDKRVGGSADKAGIETPILDGALIMQGSSMQWVNDTFFCGDSG